MLHPDGGSHLFAGTRSSKVRGLSRAVHVDHHLQGRQRQMPSEHGLVRADQGEGRTARKRQRQNVHHGNGNHREGEGGQCRLTCCVTTSPGLMK